jgi:hypothetical protein
MSFEHFDRFFLLFAIGLGLFLVGGLNLAFGRRGGRVWLRAAATLAVCAAVAGGLWAIGRPQLAAQAGGALAGVLVAAAVLGSSWLARQLAALLSYLHRPAVRWGLVSFGGLAVVVGGGIAFDRADEAAIERDMNDLSAILGKPDTHPATRDRATTDRGTPLTLLEPNDPRAAEALTVAEDKILRNSPYFHQMIRRSGPSDTSNCHGWVFTGGKYFLGPDDVEAILKENGYGEVQTPQPGDVVIYRQNGVVSHTAVVQYVAPGQPVMVTGKWGTLGVYTHAVEHSYYGSEYTFYRSARSGHLLVGLGGVPGPDAHPTE